MKRWDTTLFNDELDMLQCRLEELEDSVYRHVVVEARLDHRGNPKPLYYADNRERFSAWADRIIHVVADVPTLEETPEPWDRERAMREAIRPALAEAGVHDEDMVLLCDVDEIPSPVTMALEPDSLMAINMLLAMFAVDWVYPEQTRIAVAGRWEHYGRAPLWLPRNNGPRGMLPLVHDGGWHFTWLGGPQAIERKVRQFCHTELAGMILEGNEQGDWYQKGYTWHGAAAYPPPLRSGRLLAAEVNELWPRYIRERRCPQVWFRPTD